MESLRLRVNSKLRGDGASGYGTAQAAVFNSAATALCFIAALPSSSSDYAAQFKLVRVKKFSDSSYSRDLNLGEAQSPPWASHLVKTLMIHYISTPSCG